MPKSADGTPGIPAKRSRGDREAEKELLVVLENVRDELSDYLCVDDIRGEHQLLGKQLLLRAVTSMKKRLNEDVFQEGQEKRQHYQHVLYYKKYYENKCRELTSLQRHGTIAVAGHFKQGVDKMLTTSKIPHHTETQESQEDSQVQEDSQDSQEPEVPPIMGYDSEADAKYFHQTRVSPKKSMPPPDSVVPGTMYPTGTSARPKREKPSK